MARPTKQRPPVKQEAEEMEAQEMGETSEEETREGTEDGASMKNSRKRSPKGAKNTKAPMDAECGTCKSGKPCSCKAKKDGGCGSYGKRGDALTPQEYLAACDLGIQDRSRIYIRARLDATERLDLKCGNGSISEGEKCSKGSAQKVQGKGGGNGLKTAAKIAAVGGLAVGAGYLAGRTGLGQKAGAALRTAASELGQAGKEIGNARKYGLKMQVKVAKQAGANIRGRAKLRALTGGKLPESETLYGRSVNPWVEGGSQLGDRARARRAVQGAKQTNEARLQKIMGSQKEAFLKSVMNRRAKAWGKKDSMYAAGFTPDFNQLAI
jgi:hypothetical protein